MSAFTLLSTVQTAEALEKAIEALTPEFLAALGDEEATSLKSDCNAMVADTGNELINAKTRRRIKRVTENIDNRSTLVAVVKEKERAEQAAAGAPTSFVQTGHYTSSSAGTGAGANGEDNRGAVRAPKGETITHTLSMRDATERLRRVGVSTWDVNQVLNNLSLPPQVDGKHASEYVQNRETLRSALDAVSKLDTAACSVKGVLKRRVQRLQFSLQDDIVKEKQVQERKEKAAANPLAHVQVSRASAIKTATPSSSSSATAVTTPVVPTIPARPLSEVIDLMKAAKNMPNVDSALLYVTSESAGTSAARSEVIALLEAAMANENLVSNSKDRRRVKRAIEAVQNPTAPAPVAAAKVASSKMDVVSSSSSPSAGAKTLKQVYNDLCSAITAAEVLTALAGMPLADSFDSSDHDATPLVNKLHEMSSATGTTAPVRRRIARALALLDPATASKLSGATSLSAATAPSATIAAPKSVVITAAAAAKNTSLTVVTLHNPPAGPPLDDVITAVRAATSAADLENAISTVRAGSGNNRSRRALKRAISAKLEENEKAITGSDESTNKGKEMTIAASMNSKQRRSISRMLTTLEGKADTGVKEIEAEELIALVGDKKAKRLLEGGKEGVASDDEVAEEKRRKLDKKGAFTSAPAPIPYVVYVGQLNYKTTAEDLIKHLNVNGIKTEVPGFAVRLMTREDNATKVSRGAAFVQLSDTEDLHMCLGLHHSILHGRRLNVEKSCGGRNKEMRSIKLAERRHEQNIAVKAKINTVLEDFENRGVISVTSLGSLLKERLYSCTAAHVAEILENFSNKPKEERGQADLDATMDRWEEERYGSKGGNFVLAGAGGGYEYQDNDNDVEMLKMEL